MKTRSRPFDPHPPEWEIPPPRRPRKPPAAAAPPAAPPPGRLHVRRARDGFHPGVRNGVRETLPPGRRAAGGVTGLPYPRLRGGTHQRAHPIPPRRWATVSRAATPPRRPSSLRPVQHLQPGGERPSPSPVRTAHPGGVRRGFNRFVRAGGATQVPSHPRHNPHGDGTCGKMQNDAPPGRLAAASWAEGDLVGADQPHA